MKTRSWSILQLLLLATLRTVAGQDVKFGCNSTNPDSPPATCENTAPREEEFLLVVCKSDADGTETTCTLDLSDKTPNDGYFCEAIQSECFNTTVIPAEGVPTLLVLDPPTEVDTGISGASAPAPPTSSGSDDDNSVSPFIFAAVAAVAFALFVVVVLCLCRHRKGGSGSKQEDSEAAHLAPNYPNSNGMFEGAPAGITPRSAVVDFGPDDEEPAPYPTITSDASLMAVAVPADYSGSLRPSPYNIAPDDPGRVYPHTPPGSGRRGTLRLPGDPAAPGDSEPLSGQLGPPGDALVAAAENRERQELLVALDDVLATRNPPPLAGAYTLINERTVVGQTVIQFARSARRGADQFLAVKFYVKRPDYDAQAEVYAHPAKAKTLPRRLYATANDASAGATLETSTGAPGGYVYPPFMVVERGVTMAVWKEAERSNRHILGMFKDLARHLHTLHSAGIVHRDLKPDNILLMMQSQTWTVIDFAISAKQGDKRPATCTLRYAAPEVVKAVQSNEDITVDSAQDIWTLAVMVYECVTGTPISSKFSLKEECFLCANGTRQYPWEKSSDDGEFEGSVLADTLRECLNRDPALRPRASEIVEMLVTLNANTVKSL